MDFSKNGYPLTLDRPLLTITINNNEHNGVKLIKKAFSRDDLLTLILRLGTSLCFAGWAWVHYYWEGPYAILAWNETVFQWATAWGYRWDDIVGSGANDGLFQKTLSQVYWAYLVCALVSWSVKKNKPLSATILVLGSFMLTILMFAKYLNSKGQLPMFIEHGGQMLMPVILVSAFTYGCRHKLTLFLACIAFLCTFTGHGCYALGLWPTPSIFYGMTTIILGLDFEMTRSFLFVVGALDFIVCIGIFFAPTRVYCTLYAAGWGLITALARPVAGMSLELNFWGADQFIHETVLRAPHFMIPLYLFFLWKKKQARASETI
jgi:Na+-translocating ferredoxin:NAD+ oxidoreductase RnfE subunit